MPVYTIPPDTRAVGTADPPGDMNNVADMLGLISALFGQLAGAGTNADPGGNATNVAAANSMRNAQSLKPGAAGTVLRSAGASVNPVFASIAAGDLPAATTGAQGAVQLDNVTSDIKATGTQATGSSVKVPSADHVHPWGGSWLPSDDGFLGANGNPEAISGGGLLVNGTLYLARIIPRYNQTITTLYVAVTTVGSGTSTGCFMGLYSSSGGAALSTTTDCASVFTGGTGARGQNLQVAQAVTGGSIYYIAVLCNLGTTAVTLARQNNTATMNSPQASANVSQLRWAQQPAFGTTMGSVTLSSNAGTGFSIQVYWS